MTPNSPTPEYVLVPREPTAAMIEAALEADDNRGTPPGRPHGRRARMRIASEMKLEVIKFPGGWYGVRRTRRLFLIFKYYDYLSITCSCWWSEVSDVKDYCQFRTQQRAEEAMRWYLLKVEVVE
jgi:hypothetical protein